MSNWDSDQVKSIYLPCMIKLIRHHFLYDFTKQIYLYVMFRVIQVFRGMFWVILCFPSFSAKQVLWHFRDTNIYYKTHTHTSQTWLPWPPCDMLKSKSLLGESRLSRVQHWGVWSSQQRGAPQAQVGQQRDPWRPWWPWSPCWNKWLMEGREPNKGCRLVTGVEVGCYCRCTLDVHRIFVPQLWNVWRLVVCNCMMVAYIYRPDIYIERRFVH